MSPSAKNLANFVLFQVAWFAAVWGAAQGWMWLGPAVVLLVLILHLCMLDSARERRLELVYALGVGLFGGLADSLLSRFGVTLYPTSGAWPWVPPWIVSLWIAFALLPRFSLRWLSGRPLLALLLGALGGPLSYLGGSRFGAVEPGKDAFWTWGLLALEYGLVTPLLLRVAPGTSEARRERGRP